MYQRVFGGCLLAFATSAVVVVLGACSSDSASTESDAVETDSEEDASPNVEERDASKPDAAKPDAAKPDAAKPEPDAGDAETPEPCATGTWDHDGDAATVCKPWSSCAAGTFVKKAGTSTSDQQCEACATGTYSSAPDQTSCLTIDECAAGTELTGVGTPSSNAECTPCETGTYCAGGTVAKAPCEGETWDDDAKASTACVAWSACAPGTIVDADGSALANRKCKTCPVGQTSTTTNATTCEDVPPVPGGPCATVGKTFEKSCGNCGTQTATCGEDHVVTDFGACNEPANACAPGSVEAATACGYCGTTARTCNDECTWQAQACVGESTAADRCMAGETRDRTEGCQDDVTRNWTCGASCAWETPTLTCEAASRIVTIGTTVGATTSRRVTQNTDKIKRLVSSSSTPCTISGQTDSNYVYIELKNPNSTPAKVEIGAAAVAGQPTPSVLIAAYTTNPGVDATARKSCINGAEYLCLGNNAYASCLIGTKAPTIPAKGSIWVYVGNFTGSDDPLTFDLKTKLLTL